MTLHRTLSEFSTFAAEKFIQTVVFIDDKIYERKSGYVANPKVEKPPVRKAALKSPAKVVSEKVVESRSIPELEEFSTHDIVSSFAKKNIVCSLYQPREGASVSEKSDVYRLCLASDIVVLDWDLGDAGKKTLDLISNLVRQSLQDVPEQLRLILIYTHEPNLFDVANQVYEKLSASLGDVEPQKGENGLALHTSNSRVVILGKPGHRLPEYDPHTVNEKNLADRSIAEFSKLASGLLQSAVLLGLAEIRGNSRKILSKFDSTLDPAFLTHRALSLPDEEASNHVVPLLVAELQSILEDCLPSPVITSSIIENWCADKWEPGPPVRALLTAETDAKRFATDLCLTGPKIRETYPSETGVKKLVDKNGLWQFHDKEGFVKLSTFLHPNNDSKGNHNLSILMSQRTYYNAVPRILTLGTIVRSIGDSETEYLLCLHPLCDSVRLENKRKFVFCSLDIRIPENGIKKASHVVFDNGQFVELFFSPKSFNCVTKEFEPDSREKKVLATSNEREPLGFTSSCDNKRYVWVAQLKPDHAQRAVEQFARELSRVGLTESEWLRLMAK